MRFIPNYLIKKCRQANLYRYLLDNYSNDVTMTANGLQICFDYPLWVGQDFSGFIYYEGMTERTGNAIDCLMDFLGLSLQQACEELLPYTDMEHYENLPKI